MGDFLRARFSIRSTQWPKVTAFPAGSLRSATLAAEKFTPLSLLELSLESPNQVVPQSEQLSCSYRQNCPALDWMKERAWTPVVDSRAVPGNPRTLGARPMP
jgi:hypothetical protein